MTRNLWNYEKSSWHIIFDGISSYSNLDVFQVPSSNCTARFRWHCKFLCVHVRTLPLIRYRPLFAAEMVWHFGTLCYYYFVFFFIRDTLAYRSLADIFWRVPKKFSTLPWKKLARGQDGDNELGDLWGTFKVARASVYLICASPSSPLFRLLHRKLRREQRWRYLSCQCALSSRIFTTLKFHTHGNPLAAGFRYY